MKLKRQVGIGLYENWFSPVRKSALPSPALALDLTSEATLDALNFSRTTGAVRIASDGYYRWARENLCRYTDGSMFSNAVWIKSNCSITNSAYTIASGEYAGTKMGLMARNDAVTNAYGGTATISSLVTRRGMFHGSLLVKGAGAGALFGIRVQGSYPSRVDAVFNLDTGALVGTLSTTYTLTSAWSIAKPDGCWELHITGVTVDSAISNLYFGPTTGAVVGNWEASGSTVSAYIGRPQLNSGYNTTYYEAQALMRFMPRMKRDWQGNVLGLWSEPAATNLATNSEAGLTQTSGVVLTSGIGHGDFASQIITSDSSSASKFARVAIASITTGLPYTFTALVRAPSGPVNVQFAFSGSGFTNLAEWVTLNLDGNGNCAQGSTGAGLRNIQLIKLAGGWWQINATATSNASTTTSPGPLIGLVPSSTSSRLEVNSVSGMAVEVACAQFVQAEEWSSYVPTFGASATRAADVATYLGASGPELVIDGSMPDGTSAWTPASTAPSTSSISGGIAYLTADGTNRARLRQNVVVEVGKTYRIQVNAIDAVEVWIGSQSGFTDLLQVVSGSGVRQGTFTATTAMASITITTLAQGAFRFDDVSLREAAPCESYVQAQGSIVVVAERNVVPSVAVTVNRTFAALYRGVNTYICLLTGAGSPSQHRCDVLISGVSQAQLLISSTSISLTKYSIGAAYMTDMFYANQTPNGQIAADSSGAVPSVYALHIGHLNSSAQPNGAVKSIYIFNKPLTKSQLLTFLNKAVNL